MAAASVVTPAALAADILPAATAAIWATLLGLVSVLPDGPMPTTPATASTMTTGSAWCRHTCSTITVTTTATTTTAGPRSASAPGPVGAIGRFGLATSLYSGGRTAQRTAPSAGIPRILARRRRRFGLRLDPAPLCKIDRRIQDHLIAWPQRVIH